MYERSAWWPLLWSVTHHHHRVRMWKYLLLSPISSCCWSKDLTTFFHPIRRLGVETLPNSNSETRSGSASGIKLAASCRGAIYNACLGHFNISRVLGGQSKNLWIYATLYTILKILLFISHRKNKYIVDRWLKMKKLEEVIRSDAWCKWT